MLSTKFKSLKKLAALSAIATMCGFAKAEEKEFTPAGEITDMQMVNGALIVESKGSEIAGVKVPYTFMPTNSLDAGFAPAAISNATSVVSDTNGTCFATTADGKVFKFKVGEHGIPSEATQMAFKTVEDGHTNDLDYAVTLFGKTEDRLFGKYSNKLVSFEENGTNLVQKSDGRRVNDGIKLVDFDGKNIAYLSNNDKKDPVLMDLNFENVKDYSKILASNPTTLKVYKGNIYTGNAEGKVGDRKAYAPVSGLSVINNELYAFSSSTNELKCISDNLPNVSVNTKNGIVKVLDNPAKKNTLYFATTNSVGRMTY